MKVLIVLSFLATSLAAPQVYYRKPPQPYYPQPQYYNPANFVPIVSQTNEVNPDGSFRYSYVSGDGQQAQAEGYLKNAGYKDQEAEVVQGSYSYTAPDGSPISVSYVADENGYRAEGAHLPTPPPVPEAIQRSLAFNAQQERLSPGQYDQYNNQNQYQPFRRFK